MRQNKIVRNILLNPGPATTTDTVKYAQVIPDICPREEEFGTLLHVLSIDLTKIVGDPNEFTTVLFGGSGTAVMDSVLSSVVATNRQILIISNGAYGERLMKIAEAYSIESIVYKCDYSSCPNISEVEELLISNDRIDCVAMVHHETTTGLLNPLKGIGALAKKYKKKYIVDAISSYAGIPINMNNDNIDFLLSTSNKCLQGMPGLAFIICRNSELDKIKEYSPRNFYLNLYQQFINFKETNQTRFTPPVQTVYALKQALDELVFEGINQRIKRYQENYKVLKQSIQELGFKTLLPHSLESKLLLTIIEPDHPNYNFTKLHDILYSKGFTIYPGKIGELKTFRIAVIGDLNKDDIIAFIINLEDTLYDMGITLRL